MEPLIKAIKETCVERGMDVVGVANLESINFPEDHPVRKILPDARRIIVFGKSIPHENYFNGTIAYTNIAFAYFSLLDCVAHDITYFLRYKGYPSYWLGSNRPVVLKNRKIKGIISLKHAAQAAGLGTIGKNTLLLNKQFGPRLRLGGLLTTADFPSDSPLEKAVCIDGCKICIEKCPHRALKEDGIDFYTCLLKAHGHKLIFLTHLLKITPNLKAINSLMVFPYNTIGAKYSYICWECITSCPLFRVGQKK